jgi:hypothetical protein
MATRKKAASRHSKKADDKKPALKARREKPFGFRDFLKRLGPA